MGLFNASQHKGLFFYYSRDFTGLAPIANSLVTHQYWSKEYKTAQQYSEKITFKYSFAKRSH